MIVSASGVMHEDLTLMDIEPYTPKQLAKMAKELLETVNTKGMSHLNQYQQVELRLIRSYFEV